MQPRCGREREPAGRSASSRVAATRSTPPSSTGFVEHTSWHNCGTVRQGAKNGYTFANRVQGRDHVPCSVARYLALHFFSGGYSHHGLTCNYAPMGSGNIYWDWTCGDGSPGDRWGPPVLRGHSIVTKQ